MDQTRFDALARRLAAGATRRAGLKAALGGLLGLLALPATEGEAKRKHKKKRNALCSSVCPSGSACVDGACACTRELCDGRCCAGNQTCQDGRCAETGLRNCSGVAIVDGADLSYCRLSGTQISIRALKNANFDGADLTGTRFTGQFQPSGCSFRGATLVRADLFECDIKPGTSFVGANLSDAALMGGRIDGADFSSANLSFARFHLESAGVLPHDVVVTNSRFVDADLSGAKLHWSSFSDSDLTNANLLTAGLDVARFTKCSLRGANMLGTTLRRARFTDSVLDGANLDTAALGWNETGQALYDSQTRFTRCSMNGASMQYQTYSAWSNNPGIVFTDVDLRNARFSQPYRREGVAWLRTDLSGASGWQEPAGGYAWWCSNTLPSGAASPDRTWYQMDPGIFGVDTDPAPCSQAPGRAAGA